LVQFFIIKDDDIGRELKRRLIAKSRDGVRCFVLYDEIGSLTLPQAFIDELRQSGVEVEAFKTTKGFSNRFQINFRNHRKIVIADGKVAFVGGHNVGDEYLGRDKNFGRWRDTHVRLVGPVVLPIQIVFLQDWYWATERLLEVNLDPELSPEGDIDVLTLPSAPVDEIEACTLFFLTAINNAQEKLWIASPYFVPDEAISTALQMAALRGVDVRILIPSKPDHLMVYLAAFSYLQEMEIAGVKVFRYESGFLHQKVLLVDDTLASVGTANLDNRSFRLNFEISMVFANQRFVKSVESMLLDDFDQAVLASYDDYQRRWLGFKFGVRVARLLSPIL
jgi:cardiolipin synthase